MNLSDSSFKIYVGTFPERNVSFSANSITVYQIGKFKYEATKILNNLDIINEFYGEGGTESCTSSLFGCTEKLIVPVPPTTCPGGGGGGTGPAGPPGPAGTNGANGLNGKSIFITVADVIPLPCSSTPLANISPPADVPGSDNTQSQTLTLSLPVSCGGGEGGSPTVNVDNNSETTTEAERINFRSGINAILNSSKTDIAGVDTIHINATCTAVGFIKLLSVTWDATKQRWRYRGLPQLFMSTTRNTNNPGESFPLNYVATQLAYSTGIGAGQPVLENILNWAEDSSPVSIPVYTDFQIAITADYPTGIPSGLIVPSRTLPTSHPYPVEHQIPLYQVEGEFFINEPSKYTIKKQGKITQARYKGSGSDHNSPIWEYEIEFGQTTYNPQAPNNKKPTFTASDWKAASESEAKGIGYNLYEVSNTSNLAYGYPISGNYVPPNSTTGTPGGFQINPQILFSHVPVGTIVDVELDSNGGFYFKSPNAIVGVCL